MAARLFVFFKTVNKDMPQLIFETKTRRAESGIEPARHRPEHVEDDNDEDDDQQG